MFEPTSRYFNLESATYTNPRGEPIIYKRRRFLPQGENLPLMVEVTITAGDRLDNIAARTLGDPEVFWRIADANNTMNPDELTETPSSSIRIPVPTA